MYSLGKNLMYSNAGTFYKVTRLIRICSPELPWQHVNALRILKLPLHHSFKKQKKKSIWNPVCFKAPLLLWVPCSVSQHTSFYSLGDFQAFPWKWDTTCLSQVLHWRVQIYLWLVTCKYWGFSGPEVAFITCVATSSITVFSLPLKLLGKVGYGSSILAELGKWMKSLGLWCV